MAVIEVKECGPQHRCVSQRMVELYKQLFEVIKNYPTNKKLSRFFPLEGDWYNEYIQVSCLKPCEEDESLSPDEFDQKYIVPAVRLMVVGRCTNGWAEIKENTAEEFSQAAVDTIVHEGFRWIRDDGYVSETYIDEKTKEEKRYNTNRSAFWRCIKQVIHQLKPITTEQERYFEHIVWSNLYPISPYEGGNAVGKLQDIQLELSKEILIEQIKYYRPTHILFITDWDYWFERFADIFPNVHKTGDSAKDNIVGCGMYENKKIVVSIRPEGKQESNFVDDVITRFKEI